MKKRMAELCVIGFFGAALILPSSVFAQETTTEQTPAEKRQERRKEIKSKIQENMTPEQKEKAPNETSRAGLT